MSTPDPNLDMGDNEHNFGHFSRRCKMRHDCPNNIDQKMKRATENTEINVGTLGDDETLMEAVKGLPTMTLKLSGEMWKHDANIETNMLW